MYTRSDCVVGLGCLAESVAVSPYSIVESESSCASSSRSLSVSSGGAGKITCASLAEAPPAVCPLHCRGGGGGLAIGAIT